MILPASIEAGLNPGGLVSRVYGDDGSIVDEAMLSDDATCDAAAERQSGMVCDGAGRAGVWDGDTGMFMAEMPHPD